MSEQQLAFELRFQSRFSTPLFTGNIRLALNPHKLLNTLFTPPTRTVTKQAKPNRLVQINAKDQSVNCMQPCSQNIEECKLMIIFSHRSLKPPAYRFQNVHNSNTKRETSDKMHLSYVHASWRITNLSIAQTFITF
jgi:hypothetical protein